MTIKETIGECDVTVGKPSKNHVRLRHINWSEDDGTVITLGYSQWVELKRAVDKMFAIIGND